MDKVIQGILIAVIILGSSWLGYDLYTQKPVIVEETSEEETIDENLIEGWQTYRNEEFGFEFQYPSEWKLGEGQYIELKNNGFLINIYYPHPGPDRGLWFVPERFSTTELDGFAASQRDLLTEDGEPFFSIILPQGLPSGYGSFRIVIDLSEGVDITSINDSQQIAQGDVSEPFMVANQILSTFKFIEPADTWFTANMSGWSVKYPPSRWCGNSISHPVCLNQSRQITFEFIDWHYGGPKDEGITICGETFDECLDLIRDEKFTSIDYERERTVNGVQGIEIAGVSSWNLEGQKMFAFEREDLYGSSMSIIFQQELSPELDEIYEKILSTIEFTE